MLDSEPDVRQNKQSEVHNLWHVATDDFPISIKVPSKQVQSVGSLWEAGQDKTVRHLVVLRACLDAEIFGKMTR